MQKIDATVKKETLFIAAFTLIFSAVMELVFLLLGYWLQPDCSAFAAPLPEDRNSLQTAFQAKRLIHGGVVE